MKKLLFLSTLAFALCVTAISSRGAPVDPVRGPLNTNDYSVSASGTVSAGCRMITFIFSSDFVGRVDGLAYTGAADASTTKWPIGEHVYRAIAYTRSAGSIRIKETR